MAMNRCQKKQGAHYYSVWSTEGLKYSLIKAPAISSALNYQQLCVVARNEERHQSKLVK